MADYDGDIKLSVSLKPMDIKKSAATLQKAVAGVFESTKGKEISAPIEKLQMSLDKATNKAQGLIQKMTQLERDIPTQAFQELQNQLKSVEKDYLQLTKAAQDPNATSGTLEALQAVKEEYIRLFQARQQMVDSGKAYDTQITDPEKYDQLGAKLNETNNQMMSLLNTYAEVSTQEEGATQAAAGYAQVLTQIAENATVANEDIVELVNKQKELQDQLEGLTGTKFLLEEAGVGAGHAQWDTTVQSIAQVEAELEEVNTQLNEYTASLQEVQGTPMTGFERLKQAVGSVAGHLGGMASSAGEAFGSFVDGVSNAAHSLSGKLSNALNRVKSLITKTFNGRSLKRGFMTVLRYTLGIRSLYILVNKIRNAVKQAINNMAQWNDGNNEVNRSMTAITSSLTAFKNSIGVAVAPLLNMLAPTLEMIIDLATQAANAIGRFFAALTGASTVMQAVKVQKDYAKSLGGTASGSKKAGKETDKLHDKLASFDDLNVLGKENETDSAGGGGGTGTDIQSMFTEIETPISNLADRLKDALAAGDFSGIGQAIGEKIRDGLNGIDWDSIKEKLSSGITMVTSFINGLFTTEGLFSSLGTAAAEGINTFVSGLHQFIDEIEWHDILYGIGEGISDFLSTLDFGEVLLTIGDGIKSAIEGLSGLLEGVDLIEVLNNITTGIKDFFENFDWAGLFKDVGRLLGDVGVLVVQLVQWLSDAFANLLINIHEYLWPYIEPYLDSLPEDAGFFDIGIAVAKGMLEGILDGLKNIGQWLFDNVFKPIYDGICEAFEINSPSKVMEEIGNFIIEGLLEGVKNLVGLVTEPFKKLVNKILELFKGLQSKAIALWTSLSNKLALVVSIIKAILTEPFVKIKDFIVDTFTSLKDSVVGVWQDIWDGIKGIINTILSGIESFCNGIIDGVNSVLGLLKTVDNLPDAVKDYVGLDNFTIPSLSHISIPRLAQGAVIPPNKEFLALLGDQKSGTNIEAPLNTIVEAFRQVLGSGYPQNGNTPIILQVDGQTIGRVLAPNLMNELGRLGYNVKVLEG